MTTASMLLTVGTTLASNECEKDDLISCKVRNTAAVELRETPATREQALHIMREWIQKNTDIKNVRQDDTFLLRFLRHKKFSIPMAQQTLLKYLNLRKFYSDCMTNLDCEEANLKEILSDGYIAVSPVRDSKGRRVIVYNMSKFNATKFTCWDMVRAHLVVYETLMEDSTDQVQGFVHVGDGSGSSKTHVTSWNPVDFARLLKWGEQSLPMRHKELQLFNVPAALKYIIDFAATKVSPKIGNRLHLHSNVKSIYKEVDVACIPKEFGGDIPMKDMIVFTKKLLLEKRQVLLDLDKMEILSTRGIISSRNSTNNLKGGMASVEGSFRKLEID
ncbi:clavesin-1 [Colias croceus]|uniref:clavesin-1 n=1 Tax=Colias crocea TaxID=72248 RepID=UPI001E27A793|nr:clavesin-1 [Colias croceus]